MRITGRETGVDSAVRERARRALAGAEPRSFWTSQPGAPEPAEVLTGPQRADLVVVGGGFSGLWTALLARERNPSADVVLVEASTSGSAASGRNGGFCSASLTHGIGNGLSRFPEEMPQLEKLGAQNLAEIEATVKARKIDCDFARTGELAVATAAWQLDGLTEEAEAARALGHEVTELDSAAVRAELDSSKFLGGTWYHDTCAMVDPAQRPETHLRLAGHFFETFPQLEEVSFEYAWGGAIDMCSRFFAFYGTACRDRVAYACGHTGLGVGASRFGANVMLDLLSGAPAGRPDGPSTGRADGQPTERTALQLVRSRPVPFPPEPARTAVVQLTRASLARADRNAGRRNLWLRVLDRLGLGFDS